MKFIYLSLLMQFHETFYFLVRCRFIFQIGFSLASSFVDCLSFFTFLRFCSGAAITGLFVGHYVYILELVGASYRTLAGKVQDFFWVIGACVMVMIAYLVRDWRHVLLIASFPPGLMYLLWRSVKHTFLQVQLAITFQLLVKVQFHFQQDH